MIDVIVIGGGPAGMSVALNLLRAGRSVLILEKENFGGQIANSPRVENIPGTKEILLFATKTCPNCKMAKMLLDKAGIKYSVVDAEENVEQTKAFGVRKAPTLIVPNADGGNDVFENASNIKGYIESLN